MKITDFNCFDLSGKNIRSDSFGNNSAVECPECSHPILFVALENQKGSSPLHKTKCRGCDTEFYIEIIENDRKIIIKH